MENTEGYSKSTWQQHHTARRVNVGPLERWGSIIGGGAALMKGLKQGGLSGLSWAILGGAVLYRGATGHCSMYASLGVNTATEGDRAGIKGLLHPREVHFEATITVNRPPEDLYREWRKLEDLPRWMSHIESVNVLNDNRSHWVMRAPGGKRLEWDAEFTEPTDNQHIAWRSVPGADVQHTGVVEFKPAPSGRGTEVRLKLNITPPGGAAGASVAEALRSITDHMLQEDLRRFKWLMETGEIPTIAGQPSGRTKGGGYASPMLVRQE